MLALHVRYFFSRIINLKNASVIYTDRVSKQNLSVSLILSNNLSFACLKDTVDGSLSDF